MEIEDRVETPCLPQPGTLISQGRKETQVEAQKGTPRRRFSCRTMFEAPISELGIWLGSRKMLDHAWGSIGQSWFYNSSTWEAEAREGQSQASLGYMRPHLKQTGLER